MTITQINATDWLIKEGSWRLMLSTATQFHPNKDGGVTAEPDVLRQAREAMKNDFVANINRAIEYFGMVQSNPTTAFVDYCSLYHPALNVTSGISQVSSATSALPPTISNQELAAHVLLPHPTFVDIATAKSQAEAYADGLFNTLLGAPTPAVAFDTLKEIADYIEQDDANYNAILTSLGNRLRIDINNQGLSGAEQDNVKRNIGIENVNNTSDVNKPISSAVSTALLGKAESSHTHSQSDITGLVAAFASKASTSHSHTISDTTGLQTALDGKQAAGSYAASTHGHVISDTTGLQTALDGKAASSHSHTISNVTGLQTALDGKSDTSHTHAISGVTGLQAILDGKAASSHTHTQSEIVGLVAALAALQPLLVSGTNIKTVNGNSLLGSGDVAISGGGDNYIELAALFSSIVTNRVLVTGWAISMTTGKNYLIEIIADYQTAATTTGGSLGFVMTTGSATIKGNVEGDISQALAGNGLKSPIYAISSVNTLAGSFFTSTGVTVINSPHGITARLYVKCTVSGVFNVQWASEVAASAAQLNAGSVMIWRQTN